MLSNSGLLLTFDDAAPSAVCQTRSPISPSGTKKNIVSKKTIDSKSDGRPKRPQSAYNLFFRDERERLLATLPVRAEGKPRRSHGKMGFQQMAQVIGSKWRNLDPHTKAYYDSLAAKEKERHAKVLKEYKMRHLLPHYVSGSSQSVATPTTTSSFEQIQSNTTMPTQEFVPSSVTIPFRYQQQQQQYVVAPLTQDFGMDELEPLPFHDITPIPFHRHAGENSCQSMADLAQKMDKDLMDQFIGTFLWSMSGVATVICLLMSSFSHRPFK